MKTPSPWHAIGQSVDVTFSSDSFVFATYNYVLE